MTDLELGCVIYLTVGFFVSLELWRLHKKENWRTEFVVAIGEFVIEQRPFPRLLNAFGKVALELGRVPEPSECERLNEISERLGSPKRALRAYVQGGGAEGVDWEQIRIRFGIGQQPKRQWEVLYEQHKELLDGFWNLTLQLGRLPEPEEFPQTGELREKIGSPKQALRMFIQKGGVEDVKRATENRRRDLLVYVAVNAG